MTADLPAAGFEFPRFACDAGREKVQDYCLVAGIGNPARFLDDLEARALGHPGAVVPGTMALAFLSTALAHWLPGGWLRSLDATFRATIAHDQPLFAGGRVDAIEPAAAGVLLRGRVFLETGDGARPVTARAEVSLSGAVVPRGQDASPRGMTAIEALGN
jgi:hypothetical protein